MAVLSAISVARRLLLFTTLLAYQGAKAEFSERAVPIAELWGSEATPTNCFKVLPAYGSERNGVQSVSDYLRLQDINTLSLDHRISAVRRCYPFNSEELSSFQLFLAIPKTRLYNPEAP